MRRAVSIVGTRGADVPSQPAMRQYLALSIVAPHGRNIAQGLKTLEVRSWQPAHVPLHDLVIVENRKYLMADDPVDAEGAAIALVDITRVTPWLPAEVDAACSQGWQPGYFAWHLDNVRPLPGPTPVVAARRLYHVLLDLGGARSGPTPADGRTTDAGAGARHAADAVEP